jgi:dTDP-4-amino-4,6-dideoxygalactose transaminase
MPRKAENSILSNTPIPLTSLNYGPEETAAVARVVKSGWLSTGPEVKAFEQEIAAFLGVTHAVAAANGTAALHLAYLALGLGPGDEIVQPALNFVAAANMTVATGATPVFADIVNVEEPTIDPADIARRLTPRTKAVVVMHYGGYPCRMAEIGALCRQRGLALIEDACHAIGAHADDGRMAGNLGDIGCFSFFSNKNLATGEGGLLSTNRDDLAERLRALRSHGMTTLTWDRHRGHASSYDVVTHGYNYRFDELRAALGRAQLHKLPAGNLRRGQLVELYRQQLAGLPGWTIPFAQHRGSSAYHLMAVLAPDETQRAHVARTLNEAGIQTSLHYPYVPQFSAFERYRGVELPLSRSFARRVITLPLFPTMTDEQVGTVTTLIRQTA